MREEFYVETKDGVTVVSVDLVNRISQSLIAMTESEEELNNLVMVQMNEQYARKEAWKLAYREVPLPIGSISLEARREIQERRNELAEMYYQKIINR